MAEQTLRSAKIVFFIHNGYDKAVDTKVSVHVTTRLGSNKHLEIARKEGFAGRDAWEDDGQHSYAYALDVASVSLAEITSNLNTAIEIHSQGSESVKFNYELTLVFDDGDPDTAEVRLTQSRPGIVLDQAHRTFRSWHIFTRHESQLHACYSVGESDG